MQGRRDYQKQPSPCPSVSEITAPTTPIATNHWSSSFGSSRPSCPLWRSGRYRPVATSTTASFDPISCSNRLRMMSPTPSNSMPPDPNHSPSSTMSTTALLRQNQELRHRLVEEATNYRRRLDTYKQAQQNQATLVSRLQTKIQQYRQRCTDLEERMQETIKTSATCQMMPKITTGPTTSQVLVSTFKFHKILLFNLIIVGL